MKQYKLLYFSPNLNPFSFQSPGVGIKIKGQIDSFGNSGFFVKNLSGNHFPGTKPAKSILKKVLRWPVISMQLIKHDRQEYRRALPLIFDEKPDIIYIRYSYSSFAFIYFLMTVKKMLPATRIILEIATYPYDKEQNWQTWTTFEDRAFRHRLKNLVDRIVTFSASTRIFGVPTISTSNGIFVEKIPLTTPVNYNGRYLNLVAVSKLADWNGYDRILKGLANYRSKGHRPDVKFIIVGDGSAREKLENIRRDLDLCDAASFTGTLVDKDLDSVFEDKHLAIGNLAGHRRGLKSNPDLKNREYCARGLPFVMASDDEAFPEETPFVYRVPADESPVDIAALVAFFEDLRKKQPDYHKKMREYATQNLDWSVQMKPVVDYLRQALN